METCIGLLAFFLIAATHAAEWTYSGEEGPNNWYKDYSSCGGNNQSPINIVTAEVTKDTDLEAVKLSASYSIKPSGSWTIKNNGHSVGITASTGDYIISEGGLGANYKLHGFHFHWGASNSTGSEHTMNGNKYPMEIHFVHYNSKYADVFTAIDKSDGLAVLGFFFEIDGLDNAALKPVVDKLSSVQNADDETSIDPMNLLDLMGEDTSGFSEYYRYSGSLTTPGCYESVTWTVFEKVLKVSSAQMAKFRDLKSSSGAALVDNYRPVMPVNNRTVYASHKGSSTASGVSVSVFLSFTACVMAMYVSKVGTDKSV